MDDFIQETIMPDLFTIQDVENDNACFYRSIANGLYYGSPYKSIKHILSMKNWGKVKNIEEVSNAYGKISDKQSSLARELQKKILMFVKNNKNLIVPILGDILLKDAIMMIHGLTWEEYVSYYEIYAGDIDPNLLKLEEDTELLYIDRWGSILEQWITSKILQVSIIVFNSQKWDNKYNKIVNGKIIKNNPEKNVRLRIVTMIGKEYLNNSPPICLIWRKHNGNGHYLVCYPKNDSIEFIKNMIENNN